MVKEISIYRRVSLDIQSLTIIKDFLSPQLININVTLGMQWLCTINKMKVNWT